MFNHVKHVSELKTERDLVPKTFHEVKRSPISKQETVQPRDVITDYSSLFGASSTAVNPMELLSLSTKTPEQLSSLSQSPQKPTISQLAVIQESSESTAKTISTFISTSTPIPQNQLPTFSLDLFPLLPAPSQPTLVQTSSPSQTIPPQPSHFHRSLVQPSPPLPKQISPSSLNQRPLLSPQPIQLPTFSLSGSTSPINFVSLSQFDLPMFSSSTSSNRLSHLNPSPANPSFNTPQTDPNQSGDSSTSLPNDFVPELKPQPRNVEVPIFVKSAHPFLYVSPNPPNDGNPVDHIEQLKPSIVVYTPANAYSNTIDGIVDQTWKIQDIVRHRSLDGWRPMFNKCINNEVFPDIDTFLEKQEKEYGPYCPLKRDIFKAFELCPLSQVEVVIVGQDPYYTLDNDGLPTAQGFSFSARRHSQIPRSLRNIFKEIRRSLPDEITSLEHADLSSWASQGVLLLNTCLTVRTGGPSASHKSIWISFINEVITAISAVNEKCIYVLWGRKAEQSVGKMLSTKNIILTSSHPSPHSARHGFDGCGHFSEINEILREQGKPGIDWNIS